MINGRFKDIGDTLTFVKKALKALLDRRLP